MEFASHEARQEEVPSVEQHLALVVKQSGLPPYRLNELLELLDNLAARDNARVSLHILPAQAENRRTAGVSASPLPKAVVL